MSKGTHEGYPRLSNAADVVRFLFMHPKVDKIKYGRMTLKSGYYISMWSTSQHRGYGSTVLSDAEFKRLKRTAEGPILFEHTTQVGLM